MNDKTEDADKLKIIMDDMKTIVNHNSTFFDTYLVLIELSEFAEKLKNQGEGKKCVKTPQEI